MSDDIDPATALGLAEVESGEYDTPDESGVEDTEPSDGVIEIPIFCPQCSDPMTVNTVVSQTDVDRNGRSRYECVCTDCNQAMLVTTVRSVGDYNELFGFDTPECEWDTEDLG